MIGTTLQEGRDFTVCCIEWKELHHKKRESFTICCMWLGLSVCDKGHNVVWKKKVWRFKKILFSKLHHLSSTQSRFIIVRIPWYLHRHLIFVLYLMFVLHIFLGRCGCPDLTAASHLMSEWSVEKDSALVAYINEFCCQLAISSARLHPHEVRLTESHLTNEKYSCLQGKQRVSSLLTRSALFLMSLLILCFIFLIYLHSLSLLLTFYTFQP